VKEIEALILGAAPIALIRRRCLSLAAKDSSSNWIGCAWSGWTIPLLSSRASQEQSRCISRQLCGSRTTWNDGHAGHHL